VALRYRPTGHEGGTGRRGTARRRCTPGFVGVLGRRQEGPETSQLPDAALQLLQQLRAVGAQLLGRDRLPLLAALLPLHEQLAPTGSHSLSMVTLGLTD